MTETTTTATEITCPACGCTDIETSYREHVQCELHTCRRCSGEFGAIGYRGDLTIALPGLLMPMSSISTDDERVGYFDYTFIGSDGPGRIHGWRDNTTGALVQIG